MTSGGQFSKLWKGGSHEWQHTLNRSTSWGSTTVALTKQLPETEDNNSLELKLLYLRYLLKTNYK